MFDEAGPVDGFHALVQQLAVDCRQLGGQDELGRLGYEGSLFDEVFIRGMADCGGIAVGIEADVQSVLGHGIHFGRRLHNGVPQEGDLRRGIAAL